MNLSEKIMMLRKKKGGHKKNWLTIFKSQDKLFQNGSQEFPIVKDTTPNMMNPRLYTTSYNKP